MPVIFEASGVLGTGTVVVPVEEPDATTETPAMGAPLESVIFPEMILVWEKAGRERSTKRHSTALLASNSFFRMVAIVMCLRVLFTQLLSCK